MRPSISPSICAWTILLSVGGAAVHGCVAFVPAAQSTAAAFSSRRTATFAPLLAEQSDAAEAAEPTTTEEEEKKSRLGLLTFDLDDTLYPISPVFTEANEAFARSMHTFGFDGIRPNDIAETGRQIREEVAATEGPEGAAALTFTETRMRAIRRQMESIKLMRGLEDVAKEWATPVSALSPVVVENCRKFASKEVSSSVVQAVYNAWEMERHHAAERNLYPEVLDALQQIKEEHPDVIIGAVTDGRANPLLMTFTLAPYFDFCVSWEDDQGGRSKFFKELSSADSEAELKWIYEAALERYKELAATRGSLKKDKGDSADDDRVWIHVGDDLAYDVGGSAACGAKTILMELADKYGQTERLRVTDPTGKSPAWALTPKADVEKRRKMNEVAEEKVGARVSFLSRLPEAINDILDIEEEA